MFDRRFGVGVMCWHWHSPAVHKVGSGWPVPMTGVNRCGRKTEKCLEKSAGHFTKITDGRKMVWGTADSENSSALHFDLWYSLTA